MFHVKVWERDMRRGPQGKEGRQRERGEREGGSEASWVEGGKGRHGGPGLEGGRQRGGMEAGWGREGADGRDGGSMGKGAARKAMGNRA